MIPFTKLLLLLLIAIPSWSDVDWACNQQGPIPFQDNDKWGYVGSNGVVIPAKFDAAGPFRNGRALVCVSAECGFIDKTGTFVTPLVDPQKNLVPQSWSNGPSPVEHNGKWGYVDPGGRTVIPFHFKYAGNFEDGLAKVALGDKYFFINERGERATPDFDGVFEFSEGLAAVQVGNQIGYIRRDGTFSLRPKFESASGISFSEGLVAVRINGKVGFIDKTGAIKISPKYDDAFPFAEGLAPVMLNNKWGYIDTHGVEVIPISFDIAHLFSEGLASVEIAGKWGYIDHRGKFVVPLSFDSAMPFCGEVAEVQTFVTLGNDHGIACRSQLLKGKHGFINHAGKYVWRDAEERTWKSPFCL